MQILNNESLFSNPQGDPLLSGWVDNSVDPFNNSIKPLEFPPTGSDLLPIDSQYKVGSTSLADVVSVNSIESNILPSSDNNSPIDPLTGEAVPFLPNTDFTSGTFVVGNTGKVSIQFLYDGGAYKSEIGIFSLTGMEEFVPGSAKFIKEAAKRALSHSEQGYIVISDANEAAKFTGDLGEANNFNWGEHEGNKTFLMQPGDKFGIILIPNGTIEEVQENPELTGNKRPLFSLATANPSDAFHVGQIADVTGEGNLFVMEDLRVDVGSDFDYNDLIFSLFGATGTVTVLDELINPNLDWRTTPTAQEIITYVQEQSALLQPTPSSDSSNVSEPIDALEPSGDEIPSSNSTVESTLDIDSTNNEVESTSIPQETDSETLLSDETTVEPTESTSIPEETESSIILSDDTDNEIESTSVSTESSPSTVGDSETSNLTEFTSVSSETSEPTQSLDETSTVSDSDTVEATESNLETSSSIQSDSDTVDSTEFADESSEEETSNAIQSDEDILAESPASSDSATTPASAEETPDSEESSLDSTETNFSSLTTDDTDLHGNESVSISEISVHQSFPNFSQGVFQVGETGAINIEYIFDGGYYQGTVGLFNLAGLSEYEWGSREFFQEIARRSLSNSHEGYVLISDSTEAAKLDGKLEDYDWNRGIKPGEKTFYLPEGTEFGLILIPDGTLQELFENPQVTGSKKPFLSLTPSDPERALHQPQLVDVTGDGNLFAWEDLQLPGGDADFNDITFKMSGATGIVTNLDEVIAPDSDWRNSQIGQQILNEVQIEAPNSDKEPPQITAQLFSDSSGNEPFNPVVRGSITDASPIIRLRAGFDATPVEEFVDVTAYLQADGSFSLDSSQLEAILGRPLSEESRVLYLEAEDKGGLLGVSAIRLGSLTPTTESELNQAIAEFYGLDPYPNALTIMPGSTRQLSVALNDLFPELNLSSSPATRYFVSHPDLLQVSQTGSLTALKPGEATLTVFHGAHSIEIPISIQTPQSGTVTIGTSGGILEAADGSLVMMPPGALATETPVNLTPLAESDLSLPLPQGFEIVGAFNLDFDQDKLNIPAQLEIPNSVGLPPGTEVYFMRKGALPDETGTWSDLWLQEESGVVGDDGIIRTSSPPWPGIIRPGEYIIAYSGLTGSATLVKGQLTLNYNVPLAFLGIVDPVSGIGQLLEPGRFGTIPALSVSYDISSVNIVAVPTVGLPIVTSLGVQRSTEGLASFSASLNMPAPAENNPNSAPIIQEVSLQFTDENGQAFEGNEPVVFLTASNALIDETQLLDPLGSRFEDLIVKFHVGEKVYEGTVVRELSEALGDNQFKVAVKVPNTVALGTARISLARQQNRLVGQNGTSPIYEVYEYDSNKIRLDEAGEYVFAALNTADRLAVLEGVDPESVVKQSDSTQLLRATIPVGTDEQLDRPSASAVTHDGTRVYVTLSRSSQVALVDAMVLAQVDTDASIEGMNPIDLPAGSSPTSIAIGSRDKYAYIADGNSEKIYVLDINPSSATYHEIIHTISVDSPTAKLNQVAISSDKRKLFVTANNGWIYVINIDPQDRPDDPNSNLRLWHEQIGAIQTATGAGGIEATADPLKMVFTNGNRSQDANGFGVLSVTDDDPLNFVATTRYANIGIGPVLDYFDVNEAVAVDVMDDGSYAFVAGRNFSGSIFQDDPRQGGNIGIIKDPFGENPQLVAATRPIPGGLLQDVVLDNENKYLYAAFNGIGGNRGGTYVFDVEEIIKTLENPSEFTIDHLDRGIGSPYYDPSTAQLVSQSDFATVPIDDINPEISIAADYQILTGDWARNQFTYGVPEGSTRSPVGTGQTFHLSVAPTEDGLELIGPIGVEEWETNSLTPTFEWDFGSTLSEEIKEVNLFVSVFEEGEGLLPWDSVVNLSDPTILPNLTSAEKREFLTQPWNGYDDFNPNRVLTATWKENEGWIWNGGENYTSTNTSFTLDPDRTLTANQTYYWAVEAVTMDGGRELKLGQFNTPSITNDSPFSSVTILTHGFNPPYISQSEIPPQFFELAGNILDAGGGGLMLRYHKPTGFWTPVNRYGQIMADFPQGENPENTENYLEQLGNYITNNYRGKPLVLLPDWAQNQESAVPDSGFTEGAADAFYASLVQLDQWLGGSVGTRNEQGELVRLYDTQGNLIRQQGDLFNSPMHFIGFSRGTIVNSEILQRLLTTYPHAGGIDENNRDLHVTTIDPHDFDQPGLSLPIIGGFRNFYEPKVQMWEGITFADNYYQTTAEPNSFTSITPNGRNLPNLLPPEDSGNAPGLQFPTDENGNFLGVPDVVEFLGTRLGTEDDANSRVGFSRQTDPIPVIGGGLGATHGRVLSWYLGTTDLELSESNPSEVTDWEDNPLYRRRSDGRYDVLFDEDFYKTYSNRVNPWYVPQHTEAGFENRLGEAPWEGIGSGWFYSELGGGKELRPYQVNGTKQSRDEIENFEEYLSSRRVPLHFDNTHSASMRGDFAVPTLFNGNFDAGIDPFGNQLNTIRQYISSGLPGWSFHNAQNPQIDLVSQLADVSVIKGKDETDYAFKLGDGLTEIVHNRFVVPDWGALRFDVHVPIPARLDDRDDYIEVYLETDTQTYTLRSQEINLPPDPEQLPPVQPEEDINPIRPAVDLREVHPSSFITPNLGVAVPPEWIQLQLNRIGFGSQGFETFQVDVPDEVRGKTAKLRFKLHGDTVAYIDDVFFQSEHLKFGNPALNEQEARRDERVSQPDSYLVEKPQFAASYNESLKTPNWVSYQLNQSWINGSSGRIRRQESGASFVQDLSLPSPPLTRVGGTTDYGAFQRGHMTRAEDRARLLESYYPDSQTGERYRIYKDYKLTYLMSNIFPQFIVNEGRDPWGGLETYLTQTLVEQQNKELYVIAGRDGQRSTFTSGGIDISVPEHTWKVVLQLEPGQGIADVTRDTIAFAVDIPNYSATERVSPGDPESPLWSRNWRDYVVSINDLEAITGYDFLSNIPTDIQEWIEGNDDPDNPRTP